MAMHIVHRMLDPPPFVLWPTAANTGVTPGTVLTRYTGSSIVTTAGTLIENKWIGVQLEIQAANVTIRNCRFQDMGYWGLLTDDTLGTGLRVENCEFDGSLSSRSSGAHTGRDSTSIIAGCRFFGSVIALQAKFGTVTGNYIHSLFDISSNPDDRHFDGITVFAGGPCLIENNAIVMPEPEGGTACLFIANRMGNIQDITVRNNLMLGNASYTVYSEGVPPSTIGEVTLQGNHIARGAFGYFNFQNNSPTLIANVLWQEHVDPTPAAVTIWRNAAPLWPKGNAGILAGITLTAYTGPMSIVTAYTLIENKIIAGTLSVSADNLTVRNCRFDFTATAVDQTAGFYLRVENCDFVGTGGSTAIVMRSGTVIHCDISGTTVGIDATGPIVVRNNYIHDLTGTTPEGVRIVGVGGTMIDRNAIVTPAGGRAAVYVFTQADIQNVEVHDNLLMGDAAYAVHVERTGGFAMGSIRITENYIDRGTSGYVLGSGFTPDTVANVEWQDGVDPTPPRVTAWLATV